MVGQIQRSKGKSLLVGAALACATLIIAGLLAAMAPSVPGSGDKALAVPLQSQPGSFEVRFELNGGTLEGGSTQTYLRAARTELPIPAKKGYAFLGWHLGSPKGKVIFELPATTTGNKVLYASWRKRTIIAHKGLHGRKSPGNSLEAFRNAKEAGFEMVETDVRFTSDSVPVLNHNSTVKMRVSKSPFGKKTRSARGIRKKVRTKKLRVSKMPYWLLQYGRISQAKSGQYGRNVTTFAECMRSCKKLGLDVRVHIKTGNDSQLKKLVRIARQNHMLGNVEWFCSNLQKLKRLKKLNPGGTFVYSHAVTKRAVAAAAKLGRGRATSMISCKASALSPAKAKMCREQGVLLGTWSVPNERAANRLARNNPYVCSIIVNRLRNGYAPELIGP